MPAPEAGARLVFLVPAILLAIGGLMLADLTNLCSLGHPCDRMTNATCESAPVCGYAGLGGAFLLLGPVTVPIALIVYRFRRVTSLPEK